MKKILVLLLLLESMSCFAQHKFPQFILAFGNDFNGDSVSIIINQVQVAKDIRLKPALISPQNLMIKQNKSVLEIKPPNQPGTSYNRIQVADSILYVKIGMNNRWYGFTMDLRKGMALIAKQFFVRVGWAIRHFLIVEQSDAIIML